MVNEISSIINASEFWDEEIFGGLKAIGYAQVGHKSSERTLIDIQELSTQTIGSYLNAYFKMVTSMTLAILKEAIEEAQLRPTALLSHFMVGILSSSKWRLVPQ